MLRRSPPPRPRERYPHQLHGARPWFNLPAGDALRLDDLAGTVVLLQFWTYVCGNCTRTVPFLQCLDDEYASEDLQVVGVHTPEVAVDRRPRNVAAAIQNLGIAYPVVMDNDFAIWNAWEVDAWPTAFLIDRYGRVRRRHVGEGGTGRLGRAVRGVVEEL